MMISNSSYFVGVVLRPQQIIRTDVCVLGLPIRERIPDGDDHHLHTRRPAILIQLHGKIIVSGAAIR